MQNFSGDARLLMITPEIKATEDTIITGMGIIPEIIRGGASWSGSNVSLRVVENTFINHRTDIQSLLDFIVKNVANYMGIPSIKIKMADFKMADDLDKKRLMVSLASDQQGSSAILSKPSIMRELGLDPDKEYKEIQNDLKKRLELQVQEAEGIAEAQGAAAVINSLYAADAQIESSKRLKSNQDEASQKHDQETQQVSEQNAQNVGQDVAMLAVNAGKNPTTISIPNLIMVLVNRFSKLARYDENEFAVRLLSMKNSTPSLYEEVYKGLREMNLIKADTMPAMTPQNVATGQIPQYSQGDLTAETSPDTSTAGSDPNAVNAMEMQGLPEQRPPRNGQI
jgi:hypothetical protein